MNEELAVLFEEECVYQEKMGDLAAIQSERILRFLELNGIVEKKAKKGNEVDEDGKGDDDDDDEDDDEDGKDDDDDDDRKKKKNRKRTKGVGETRPPPSSPSVPGGNEENGKIRSGGSMNNRTCRYHCKLCNYYCFSMRTLRRHLNEFERHGNSMRLKALVSQIHRLSSFSDDHIRSLEAFLLDTYASSALRDSDFEARQEVARRVNRDIETRGITSCPIVLFGSSYTGLGLRESADVNLAAVLKSESTDRDIENNFLCQILDIFKEHPDFYFEPRLVSEARSCKISFTTENSLTCCLEVNVKGGNLSCKIVRAYWDLDLRVRVLGVALRRWESECGLNRESTTRIGYSIIVILLNYLITRGVVPSIAQGMEKSKEWEDESSPLLAFRACKCYNTERLGDLWLGFFKYLSLKLDEQGFLISILSLESEIQKVDNKLDNPRNLSISPISNVNLLRSVMRPPSVFNFFKNCFKYSFVYFGIIQTSEGPLFTEIITDSEINEQDLPHLPGSVTAEKAKELSATVSSQDIKFEWNAMRLTNGKKMPIICTVCMMEGHRSSICPEEILPKLKRLPYFSKSFVEALDQMCYTTRNMLQPSNVQLKERSFILWSIDRFVKKHLCPTAVIKLYGSSENGFGFGKSDLDICLTFEDVKQVDENRARATIIELARQFKKMEGIGRVRAIANARIPIVRFFHLSTDLEMDLSFYNDLAVENTKLIRLYSAIDPRVQTLGYVIKHFVKRADIAKAAKGTLSSYTYIVLLIFFLQHCNPPIVPVLQELHPENQEPPEVLVKGYNVWFNDSWDDICQWKKRTPTNERPVSQLLVGFFEFFVKDFDSDKYVVCIRKHAPMTKINKMWNTSCYAVEDPFETDRNLGHYLTRRTHLFIKKCFIKAREFYGTHPPRNFRNLFDHYFRISLGLGKPPIERGCHICGVKWHRLRNCPHRMSKIKSNARKRQAESVNAKEEVEEGDEEEVEDEEEEVEVIEEEDDEDYNQILSRLTHLMPPQIYNDKNVVGNSHSNDRISGVQLLQERSSKANCHQERTVTLGSKDPFSTDDTKKNIHPIFGGGENGICLLNEDESHLPPINFIPGVIRAEDLEKSFETPATSWIRPPPGFAHPPPPEPAYNPTLVEQMQRQLLIQQQTQHHTQRQIQQQSQLEMNQNILFKPPILLSPWGSINSVRADGAWRTLPPFIQDQPVNLVPSQFLTSGFALRPPISSNDVHSPVITQPKQIQQLIPVDNMNNKLLPVGLPLLNGIQNGGPYSSVLMSQQGPSSSEVVEPQNPHITHNLPNMN